MTNIILAFQNMTPEEITVVIIVGCLSFILGVALS
jgi:hypothetical protein